MEHTLNKSLFVILPSLSFLSFLNMHFIFVYLVFYRLFQTPDIAIIGIKGVNEKYKGRKLYIRIEDIYPCTETSLLTN